MTFSMNLIAYAVSGLIAAAIVFIGARFLLSPAAAARDYGIPATASPVAGVTAWLTVKGVRDITSGLFTGLLMVSAPPRLLGEFLLIASVIAIGDASIVLRAGGSKAAAFGIHGVTALVIIATGATLIVAAN